MFSPRWIWRYEKALKLMTGVPKTSVTMQLPTELMGRLKRYSDDYRVPMSHVVAVMVTIALASDPDPNREDPRSF